MRRAVSLHSPLVGTRHAGLQHGARSHRRRWSQPRCESRRGCSSNTGFPTFTTTSAQVGCGHGSQQDRARPGVTLAPEVDGGGRRGRHHTHSIQPDGAVNGGAWDWGGAWRGWCALSEHSGQQSLKCSCGRSDHSSVAAVEVRTALQCEGHVGLAQSAMRLQAQPHLRRASLPACSPVPPCQRRPCLQPWVPL
jgi:hypothetical protein